MSLVIRRLRSALAAALALLSAVLLVALAVCPLASATALRIAQD